MMSVEDLRFMLEERFQNVPQWASYLVTRIAEQEARAVRAEVYIVTLNARIAERDARIAELEAVLDMWAEGD